MHLKSLTLKGFKSFASATTLRFEPGITCVVGPNGSGKSNVVDALTWVMGEQGAKALRGGKMQDVIFAGTAGRAPLGRAEVTLTIDNSDGALPIDYAEVSITRRMFRDGAGEYEINGNSCRLMDVQELLSDSGIGREMHVIVGQGQLSAILESRPEDRRAFIEEAAGVLKHRKRKEKALRKLEAMQANLARLTDLTGELRRQLKPLGRQAEVARRAQTVQADLRDARLRLAADDLVTRRAELESQQSKEAYAREQQITVQAELDAANAALTEQEFELARLTPSAEAAGQLWFQLSALAERVNATIRIAHDRARHLDTAAPAATGRDPEQLEAEADRVEAEEVELRAAVEMAVETLEAARDALAEREHAAKAAEQAHLAAVRAIADRREGLVRLSGQVENMRTKAQSMDADIARLSTAITEARARGEEAQAEYDAVQDELAELDAGEAGLDAQHEHAVEALDLADQRVAELRAQDRDAGKRVASLAARIEALRMNLARGDGAAWLTEHHPDGLLGPLSGLIRVHTGFEAAVAAVLGPVADAVAAESRTDAYAALRDLKQADSGRAALVYAGSGDFTESQIPHLPETAHRLVDVVDCPESVRAAIVALTDRVVVVDDLDAAAELLVAHPNLRAVTRDGDLAGAGWLIGGSERVPSRLEIQSDIDAAEAELVAARRHAEELEAALAGALEEQTERKEAVDHALLALHESDQALLAVYDRLGRLGQAARTAQAECERLTTQRAQAEQNRQETVAALAELEDRLRHAEREQDGFDADGLGAAGTEAAAAAREEAAAALAEARAMEVEAR
ncbi:chromosome segregation protein SMC, partial [Nocardia paucivorans]|uniref:chromosome segregation protein SMC n=1 Tax=Nocardia paucivorans TaxID=114259 RepID=UPI000594B73F